MPAIGAVQRWFMRRRGLAFGLAVAGIGVATLVMPPLPSFLIGGRSEGYAAELARLRDFHPTDAWVHYLALLSIPWQKP